MHLISPLAGPVSAPTARAVEPAPPARWSRWWTSPIARFDYGAGSRMPLFPEARIAAERSFTGARIPSVTYAGGTLEDAIAAARALAAEPVEVSFSYRNGRIGTTQVQPAIAVLRDARAGAFWLSRLETTVQLRGDWVDAPHSLDGAAFEGARPILTTPTVLSATRDLVAVVGRDQVIRPGVWTDAPDDSRIDD